MGIKEAFEPLAVRLEKLGVTHVEASYSGGGDEGFCEDANYIGGEPPVNIKVPDGLDEQVRDFAFDVSDVHAGGWWNNEGGYGVVEMDVAAREITINHEDAHIEYTHSEDKWS
jgi:hypothetical protein